MRSCKKTERQNNRETKQQRGKTTEKRGYTRLDDHPYSYDHMRFSRTYIHIVNVPTQTQNMLEAPPSECRWCQTRQKHTKRTRHKDTQKTKADPTHTHIYMCKKKCKKKGRCQLFAWQRWNRCNVCGTKGKASARRRSTAMTTKQHTSSSPRLSHSKH